MPPAIPHEPAPTGRIGACPRCEAGFACGRASGRCWCAGVTLDDASRAGLARRYESCLCPECLRVAPTAPRAG